MGELVEREAELAALTTVARDTRSGDGALVLVEGPAGIGKTRLADAGVRESGLRVLRARGAELEREFPLAVVHQLLDAEVVAAGDPAGEGVFAGAAALAAPVFGRGPAPTGVDPAFALVHGLYWLVANLAEREPLALLVDDVQWADAASLRWLAYLAARLEGLAVLLVATARTGEGDEPPELDALRAGTVLRPARLSEDGASTVVARRMGATPHPAFTHACHEASGGNPFLLGELLTELRDAGAAPDAAAARRVHRLTPERVARSVAARLTAQDDATRALAEAVAVLGDGAQPRWAASLAGQTVDDALVAADRLAAVGLLASGQPLCFAHPLLRRATEAAIAPGRLASLHARAAALLREDDAAPEAVAIHLLACSPAGDADAVAALRHAADAALDRGAPAPAAAYLRRALAEPPARETRGAVLAELGAAATRAGEPDAAEHLRAALDLARGTATEGGVALDLGRALIGAGHVAEGFEALADSADTIRARDPEAALLLEAELLAAATLDAGLAERAAPRVARLAAEDLRGETPAQRLALAIVTSERALAGHPAAETAAAARRALADGRLLAEQTADSTPFYLAVFTLLQGDELDAAIAELDRALAFARGQGSALGVVFATTMRSHAWWCRGDVAAAELDAATAVEGIQALGWVLGLPYAYRMDALLERGLLDEAEAELQASGIGEDVPDSLLFDPLRFSRGRLRLARGDAAAAAADFAQGLAYEIGHGVRNVAATPYRSALAEARHALGEAEEARRLAREELDLARAVGAGRPLSRALRVAALVGAGDPETLLTEAVASAEASPARLEEAYARVALGEVLRRAGRRTAARDALAAGRELAHRCGARALADRALEELRVAGARPRRFAVSGVEALTAAERRAALLAAEGMSNREIAQALFLTTKTVETHLSRTYGKLGIASRADLPQALGLLVAA